MMWPDAVHEGVAKEARTRGSVAYGVPPAPCGYRLADLRCTPTPRGRRVSGVYSEIAVGVVLSGAFEYQSEGQRCQAVPGTLLFANKGKTFSCHHQVEEGNRRVVLFLSDHILGPIAEDLSLDAPKFKTVAAPPSQLTPAILGFLSRIARQASDSYEAALAVATATLQCSANRPFQQRIPAADTRRILEVVRYVNANFSTPCSLDTLGSIAGMNRFRFARTFRAVTGESPNQYLVNRRLCAAAASLASTRRPISEIAYDAGFNDISWFNARFRRTFGCAPGAWRKRC